MSTVQQSHRLLVEVLLKGIVGCISFQWSFQFHHTSNDHLMATAITAEAEVLWGCFWIHLNFLGSLWDGGVFALVREHSPLSEATRVVRFMDCLTRVSPPHPDAFFTAPSTRTSQNPMKKSERMWPRDRTKELPQRGAAIRPCYKHQWQLWTSGLPPGLLPAEQQELSDMEPNWKGSFEGWLTLCNELDYGHVYYSRSHIMIGWGQRTQWFVYTRNPLLWIKYNIVYERRDGWKARV